ncbi:hypothetical protein HQ529_03595 [Candidatus Woesearchaeota archaeon]|nr:hypothetical protein [Candidatus Woesearchaeota archaeon]
MNRTREQQIIDLNKLEGEFIVGTEPLSERQVFLTQMRDKMERELKGLEIKKLGVLRTIDKINNELVEGNKHIKNPPHEHGVDKREK